MKNYQVLARKYRPISFASLVGQEALVKTLSNAIKMDRIAHAFLLTGIRGIGKTTTARIIAKSINCTDIDKSKPIIEPCGKCNNCSSFAQDKHPDVIEMDAASKTGINDIREIIENANYLPLLGKVKIYIIDEVHMLSNNAFNALLKTLEEPPSHVKFIFATTEIKKIPITVLSRCQKFDLRRLSNESLITHLANIAKNENITIEEEALAIIAAQSEGSVRDSLSLLDQAIAHSLDGDLPSVTASIVRNMLGISSKIRLFELFELIINGDAAAAISFLRSLYEDGADPILVIEELLELTHFTNKLLLIPELCNSTTIPETERIKGKELASKLDTAYLTTIWQMLLKGLQEVRYAPSTINAAEMLLIRLCYMADLPSPIDLIKTLKKNDTNINPSKATTAPKLSNNVLIEATETITIKSFKELVQLFYDKKEFILHHYLVEDVHLVGFEEGKLEFRPTANAPKDLANKLSQLLFEWTGRRWIIVVSNEGGASTLSEEEELGKQRERKLAENNPIVKAVLNNFPGATITNVHNKQHEHIITKKEQSNG